jgi:hypothetical protein
MKKGLQNILHAPKVRAGPLTFIFGIASQRQRHPPVVGCLGALWKRVTSLKEQRAATYERAGVLR